MQAVVNQISHDSQPVALMQDRYGGTYSRGQWLAVCNADQLVEGASREIWAAEHGPGGCDREAEEFWSKPPRWIAAGDSPETAKMTLLRNQV